jgi:mono/diheme cytochrome c family protein
VSGVGGTHRRAATVIALGTAAMVIALGVAEATAMTGVPTDAEVAPPQGDATPANPVSGDAEAIADGHQLYVKWCQQCHGVQADGVSERWGKYAADLRVFWRGYYEFVRIVVEGRPDKQMPPWGAVLDGNDIAEIGAFLETKAIDGANWK